MVTKQNNSDSNCLAFPWSIISDKKARGKKRKKKNTSLFLIILEIFSVAKFTYMFFNFHQVPVRNYIRLNSINLSWVLTYVYAGWSRQASAFKRKNSSKCFFSNYIPVSDSAFHLCHQLICTNSQKWSLREYTLFGYNCREAKLENHIWFLREWCHLPGTYEDNEIFMNFLNCFGNNMCWSGTLMSQSLLISCQAGNVK